MGRKLLGALTIVVGLVVLLLSPAAHAADPLLLFPGVTAERVVVQAGQVGQEKPTTLIKVTGPPVPARKDQAGQDIPAGEGCQFGILVATPVDKPFGPDSKPFGTSNALNGPGQWSVEQPASTFPVGTYTIHITCSGDGYATTTFRTEATFNIVEADQVPVQAEPDTPGEAPPTPAVTKPTPTSVDPTTARPGVTVLTLRGSGFKADTDLTITLDGTFPVATVKALPNGEYAATLKLPANAPPGEHQLVVTGLGPDGVSRSTTVGITVQKLSCPDFTTSAEAQAAMGPGTTDAHGLDPEKDGVACQRVAARSAAGSSGGTATAASAPGPAAGTLPATGSRHAPLGLVVGISCLALGSLLVGLSHPVVPAAGDPSCRRGLRP